MKLTLLLLIAVILTGCLDTALPSSDEKVYTGRLISVIYQPAKNQRLCCGGRLNNKYTAFVKLESGDVVKLTTTRAKTFSNSYNFAELKRIYETHKEKDTVTIHWNKKFQ